MEISLTVELVETNTGNIKAFYFKDEKGGELFIQKLMPSSCRSFLGNHKESKITIQSVALAAQSSPINEYMTTEDGPWVAAFVDTSGNFFEYFDATELPEGTSVKISIEENKEESFNFFFDCLDEYFSDAQENITDVNTNELISNELANHASSLKIGNWRLEGFRKKRSQYFEINELAEKVYLNCKKVVCADTYFKVFY